MARESLLLHDGTVYPLDDELTTCDSILFENGEVVAVGDGLADEYDPDRTFDLEGRTVLPGFNDAHTHFLAVGNALYETDLDPAADRTEAISLLEENAADTESGRWVLGLNYDESTWPPEDRSYFTREELDAVSEDHPIAVQRVDGHTISLNSTALERVDFAGVEHDVRTDESGEPTGVVVEDAVVRVSEATYPDLEKARATLDLAIERAHELGITSVQDMAGMTTPNGPGDAKHAALQAAWREGELPIRVGYYVHLDRRESLSNLEVASGFGDETLRILGMKVFSDGSIGAQTAKLSGEFADDPGNDGQYVIDRETMSEAFATAARANQQISTHAIGDEAITFVLDAYEEVIEEYDVPEPRLRIEHLEIATDEQLERMADLGVVASMQPNFMQWSQPDGLYEARLGEEWRRTNNRFRDVLDAGIPLAFGSDKMPFGALYGIHHAVNAPHGCQRLTVEEAIRAYTEGAAYAEFEEERKGRLEPGMLADAVVLDRDPFDHPEEIRDIDVAATIVDGEVVYENGA